jgi:hypothetical protein
MKMHQRLIPEWKHAVNQFCEMEGVTEQTLQSDSLLEKHNKLRERFYCYCAAQNIPPKEAAKGTNRSVNSVYVVMRKSDFWDKVNEFK